MTTNKQIEEILKDYGFTIDPQGFEDGDIETAIKDLRKLIKQTQKNTLDILAKRVEEKKLKTPKTYLYISNEIIKKNVNWKNKKGEWYNFAIDEVLQLIKELKDENQVVRECGCDRNEYCNKCSNLDHYEKKMV